MKKKILMILITSIAILVFAIIFVVLMNSKESFSKYNVELNEQQIACQEGAIYQLLNNANITTSYYFVENKTYMMVQNIKCSGVEYSYSQVEIKGYIEDTIENETDTIYNTKPVYFHIMQGGRAASGQDMYKEVCLKIDNQTIISYVLKGRNGDMQNISARCGWQKTLQ